MVERIGYASDHVLSMMKIYRIFSLNTRLIYYMVLELMPLLGRPRVLLINTLGYWGNNQVCRQLAYRKHTCKALTLGQTRNNIANMTMAAFSSETYDQKLLQHYYWMPSLIPSAIHVWLTDQWTDWLQSARLTLFANWQNYGFSYRYLYLLGFVLLEGTKNCDAFLLI
jgi:hypothetical protein